MTVALVRVRAHGAESDAPIEQAIWQVCEWREGRCVWWRSVRTEGEALEVA